MKANAETIKMEVDAFELYWEKLTEDWPDPRREMCCGFYCEKCKPGGIPAERTIIVCGRCDSIERGFEPHPWQEAIEAFTCDVCRRSFEPGVRI